MIEWRAGNILLLFNILKTIFTFPYILWIWRRIRLSLTNWSPPGPCLGWWKVQVKTQICHLTKLVPHPSTRVMVVYYPEVPVPTWNPLSRGKEILMNSSGSNLQDCTTEVQVLNQSSFGSGWRRIELAQHRPTILNKVHRLRFIVNYTNFMTVILSVMSVCLFILSILGF